MREVNFRRRESQWGFIQALTVVLVVVFFFSSVVAFSFDAAMVETLVLELAGVERLRALAVPIGLGLPDLVALFAFLFSLL